MPGSAAMPSATPIAKAPAVVEAPAEKLELAEYKRRLEAIYRVHNPSNVAKVDYLMNKYIDKEDLLYHSVICKYKIPENWDGQQPLHPSGPIATTPAATEAKASATAAVDQATPAAPAAPAATPHQVPAAAPAAESKDDNGSKDDKGTAAPSGDGETLSSSLDAATAAPLSASQKEPSQIEEGDEQKAADVADDAAAQRPKGVSEAEEEDDYDPFGGNASGAAEALAALGELAGAMEEAVQEEALQDAKKKPLKPPPDIPSAKGMALIDFLLVGEKMGFFSDEEEVAEDMLMEDADDAESDEELRRYQQVQQQLLKKQQEQELQQQQKKQLQRQKQQEQHPLKQNHQHH